MWQAGVGQGVTDIVGFRCCLIADVAGRYRGGCCLDVCWECRWRCLIAEWGGKCLEDSWTVDIYITLTHINKGWLVQKPAFLQTERVLSFTLQNTNT